MRVAAIPVPFLVLVPVAAGLALPGCVERKMIVRSDPPGALIHLDDEAVGQRTPAEIPFVWGGTRRVTLVAPGHRVLEATAEVEDPWYTYFPVDLFAEFLWPATIVDRQEFSYRLDPYHPITEPLTAAQQAELDRRMEELRVRAEEYRAGGSEGPGGRPAPAQPPAADSGQATPPPPPPPRRNLDFDRSPEKVEGQEPR